MSPKVKVLALYGEHGSTVKAFEEPARRRCVVRWYEQGLPKKKTFPGITAESRAEAKHFAKVFHHARQQVMRQRASTSRELFEAYVAAKTSGARPWREPTRKNALWRWSPWEEFIGRETDPDAITLGDLDRFWARCRQLGANPNQTKQTVSLVKAVYRYGFTRKLIQTNEPAGFENKLAPTEGPMEVEEYHPTEYGKLIGALDPTRAGDWRLWCLLKLAGSLGARIRTLLELRWDDFNLAAGTITLRPEAMKQGREHVQPLPADAVEAYHVAAQWATTLRTGSRWVFPAASIRSKRAHYTYQAAWLRLRRVEDAAGVTHQPFRAFHGARRMVVSDIYDATGDLEAAMDFIGDRDLKQKRSYLKRRDERREKAKQAVDGASRNRSQNPPQAGVSLEPLVGIEPTTARVGTTAQPGKSNAGHGDSPQPIVGASAELSKTDPEIVPEIDPQVAR